MYFRDRHSLDVGQSVFRAVFMICDFSTVELCLPLKKKIYIYTSTTEICFKLALFYFCEGKAKGSGSMELSQGKISDC